MCLLFKHVKPRSILNSFQCSYSEVNAFKSNWHNDIDLHGTYNSSTNVHEPLSIEIWVSSQHVDWFNKSCRKLPWKISCTKHRKHTCIEELTYKNYICYELQLDGFSITSAIAHDQRNNCSDNIIDNNDQIFNRVVLHKCFEVLVNVLFAYFCMNFCSILGFPFGN